MLLIVYLLCAVRPNRRIRAALAAEGPAEAQLPAGEPSVPPQDTPPADGLDLYAIYRPAPDDADEGEPNENGGE